MSDLQAPIREDRAACSRKNWVLSCIFWQALPTRRKSADSASLFSSF